MLTADLLYKLQYAVSAFATADVQTMAEAKLVVAVATDNLEGEARSIMAYAKPLKMSASSLSRIAFDLAQRKVLKFEPHATDRRKKILRIDSRRF